MYGGEALSPHLMKDSQDKKYIEIPSVQWFSQKMSKCCSTLSSLVNKSDWYISLGFQKNVILFNFVKNLTILMDDGETPMLLKHQS